MTVRLRRWLMPPLCRFYPTCSQYAYQAIEWHGLRTGGWLSLKRLARCHPLHPGGIDPVPTPAFTPSNPVNQEISL